MPRYVLRADGETDPIEAPDDATAIDLLADRVGEWVDEDRLTETEIITEEVIRLGEDGDTVVDAIARVFHPSRAWDCPDNEPHVFVQEQAPSLAWLLLGGLDDNPGAFGVPGGVEIVDRCLRCGTEVIKTSLYGGRDVSWSVSDRRQDTIDRLRDWIAADPIRRERLAASAASLPEAALLTEALG